MCKFTVQCTIPHVESANRKVGHLITPEPSNSQF